MQEITYAILATDDQLTYQDIINECKQDRWAPILSYTTPRNDVSTIVCFTSVDIAYQFAKRNFGKGLKGVIQLTDRDVNWINEQGWKIEKLTFPRLFATRTDITLGFQVLEFADTPDHLAFKE